MFKIMNDKNGAYLKKLRNEHNETQRELASAFGYTQKSVSAWENDRNSLSLALTHKYAERYRIPFEEFYQNYFRSAALPSESLKDSECAAADASTKATEFFKQPETVEAEPKDKPKSESLCKKRKLHPILKTFLISLTVMFVLLGIAIGVIAIIVYCKSFSIDSSQGNIYISVDIPILILLITGVLILPSIFATITHIIILLIQKSRRK